MFIFSYLFTFGVSTFQIVCQRLYHPLGFIGTGFKRSFCGNWNCELEELFAVFTVCVREGHALITEDSEPVTYRKQMVMRVDNGIICLCNNKWNAVSGPQQYRVGHEKEILSGIGEHLVFGRWICSRVWKWYVNSLFRLCHWLRAFVGHPSNPHGVSVFLFCSINHSFICKPKACGFRRYRTAACRKLLFIEWLAFRIGFLIVDFNELSWQLCAARSSRTHSYFRAAETGWPQGQMYWL